jgi:hypothetical protein
MSLLVGCCLICLFAGFIAGVAFVGHLDNKPANSET